MKIFPLSEGTFTVDQTKLFIPFNEGHDKLQERTSGSLLVEIQPFAVITSRDILLLDTGLGFLDKEERKQIHSNLATNGINPTDITKDLLKDVPDTELKTFLEETGDPDISDNETTPVN